MRTIDFLENLNEMINRELHENWISVERAELPSDIRSWMTSGVFISKDERYIAVNRADHRNFEFYLSLEGSGTEELQNVREFPEYIIYNEFSDNDNILHDVIATLVDRLAEAEEAY